MQSAGIRALVCLLIIISALGCGKKVSPESGQMRQASAEAASESGDRAFTKSGEEITPRMIEEYAMVHQMSDLKTAEFYLKNPDYAKTHPYVPTREDRAFYESRFLEKVLPQFKRIAEKQGAERARSRFMNINPHSDLPRSWKSKYRMQESFNKSATIDTKLTEATILYKADRLDEAVKSMKAAVDADPESPTLLYDLGVMHMENGNYYEAVESFQRSLDSIKSTAHSKINLVIHPKVYMGACVNLGLVYIRTGMYNEAVKILKEAIKFESDDLEANWNLAIAYWFMGDADRTAQQMRKYINLDQNSAEAHNMIGLLYYRKKLYKAALDEFQIASKLDPKETQYKYNEGWVLAKLDRYDEASQLFREISESEEGSTASIFVKEHAANKIKKLYNDGCTAMETHNSTKAIELFQDVLKLKPDMVGAHVNLGILYGMRGDKSNQIHHLKEAIKLEPDKPDVRYNLGLAYSKAGFYSEAMEEFEQAVDLDPSLRDAHFKLGVLLHKARNFGEAAVRFEKCLELSPNWSKARLNLGSCYLKTGNLEGAVEQFTELLKSSPESAVANYNLGNAYMRMGRFGQASELFQKALEIRPGYRQAQEMMKEIEAYQGVGKKD